MVDREQMAREQDADLRELAELGMSFARKLEARVGLVTNVAEAQALALAFNRIARGVRLTHALRTKLVRDHLEIGKLERSAAQRAVERRKAQITAVLDREIYVDPHTQDEADELSERLTERLDQEALFDGFLDEPLEPLVARFREHLRLSETGAEPIDPPPGRSPIEGEVDRRACDETEGVEAHSDCHSLQPPQSTASTAPPEGEHLEGVDLKDIGLAGAPAPLLTSPALAAGGGPRPAEGVVEGASGALGDWGSPPPPPALRTARPAVPLPPSAMGEVRKKLEPS